MNRNKWIVKIINNNKLSTYLCKPTAKVISYGKKNNFPNNRIKCIVCCKRKKRRIIRSKQLINIYYQFDTNCLLLYYIRDYYCIFIINIRKSNNFTIYYNIKCT